MAHVRSLFFGGPLSEIEDKAFTAYTLGRPSEIIWNITNRCNLLCEHCYIASDDHKRDGELTDEETIDLVHRMGAAGVPLLFLSGGEPMVRPNFWEILAEAKAQGIRVTISTNCTKIDREAARRLKANGVDYIATSLYGPAEFHDALVRVPGTRDKVVNAIKILREEGVGVAIKSAVSKDTWPHIYDLIQEAKDLGCGLIYLCDLITSGRSEGHDDGRISAEQWRELADFIIDDVIKQTENGEKGLEYDIGAMPSFVPYVAEQLVLRGYDITPALTRLKVMTSCPVGKGFMNINSVGGIMACQFAQDYTVGNIRDISLPDAVAKLFELGRSDSKGACSASECAYHDICRGCRTKAWHQFQDVLAEDTTCMLRQGDDREPLAEAIGSAPASKAMPCGPLGGCE